MMTMKPVNGVTTIKDEGKELTFNSISEAFSYLDVKRLLCEVYGTLPTERRGGVSTLVTGSKSVRYSVEGVPV